MYALFLLLMSAFAHPFDANLVGHRLVLDIQDTELILEYYLELPTSGLQEDYSVFAQKNGDEKKTVFISNIYQEILSHLRVEINEEIVEAKAFSNREIESRNKGKFMVFSSESRYSLGEDIQSLSVANQNRIFDPAIYRNEVQLSQGLHAANTDMVIWKDGHPHSSLLDKWTLEEQMREIRIAFLPMTGWSKSQEWWNTSILQEPSSQGLWTQIKRQDQTWFDDWKQKRTSLSSFLTFLLCAVCLSMIRATPRRWEVPMSIGLYLIFWFLPLSWNSTVFLGYLFLSLGIGVAIFRQELAFSLWLWSMSVMWIHPKILSILIGLPILFFLKKGLTVRSIVWIIPLLLLLVLFAISTA